MKNSIALIAPLSLFCLVSCGEKPTQFASPDSYRVAFIMSGTGTDRVKQMKDQMDRGQGDSIVIDSEMGAAEAAEAQAALQKSIADAIAAASASVPSGSVAGPGNSEAGTGSERSSGARTGGGEATGSSGTSTGSSGTSTGSSGTSTGSSGTSTGSSGTSTGSSGTSTGSSGSTTTALSLSEQIEFLKNLGEVSGSLEKFKRACAKYLGVNESKVIGPMVSGSVGKDEVLLVAIDKRGVLNIPLQGSEMRGMCILGGNGSTVNVDGGSTHVTGILTLLSGAGGAINVTFGANGKLDTAVAAYNGATNNVTYKGSKLAACPGPTVQKLGAGSLNCAP